MKIPRWLKGALLDTTDSVMAATPRRKPSLEQLRSIKLIAHRGAHQNHIENTLPAFRRAVDIGVWGVEFDVRWTKCGQPVVHHDFHCARVFKNTSVIADSYFRDLRRHVPDIPTLEEVIAAVGGRAHLMIEVKGRASDIKPSQWDALKEALRGLEPVRDYHLMSLNSEILREPPIAVNQAWLPIAELNVRSLSQIAIERELGGLTGQYLVMGEGVMKRHRKSGQNIGTGFVNSRSVCYREIGRQVDWIFSDNVESLIDVLRRET